MGVVGVVGGAGVIGAPPPSAGIATAFDAAVVAEPAPLSPWARQVSAWARSPLVTVRVLDELCQSETPLRRNVHCRYARPPDQPSVAHVSVAPTLASPVSVAVPATGGVVPVNG